MLVFGRRHPLDQVLARKVDSWRLEARIRMSLLVARKKKEAHRRSEARTMAERRMTFEARRTSEAHPTAAHTRTEFHVMKAVHTMMLVHTMIVVHTMMVDRKKVMVRKMTEAHIRSQTILEELSVYTQKTENLGRGSALTVGKVIECEARKTRIAQVQLTQQYCLHKSVTMVCMS